MKKYVLFVISVVIALILVITICVKKRETDVLTFKLSDYQYYIDNFSSEEIVGSISNSKDALMHAECVWIKLYGNRVKEEKPYKIFYDSENGVWLIQGTLRSNELGGVANILIENNEGKVLAVWHDK